MLSTHASFGTILIMTFFLGLRYTLLSSSLSTYMKKESTRFIALFTQSLNDENYAINQWKFSTDPNWNATKALWVNWWSLCAWVSSNMLGTLLGSHIHLHE